MSRRSRGGSGRSLMRRKAKQARQVQKEAKGEEKSKAKSKEKSSSKVRPTGGPAMQRTSPAPRQFPQCTRGSNHPFNPEHSLEW